MDFVHCMTQYVAQTRGLEHIEKKNPFTCGKGEILWRYASENGYITSKMDP